MVDLQDVGPFFLNQTLKWSWHHPAGRFHTLTWGTAIDHQMCRGEFERKKGANSVGVVFKKVSHTLQQTNMTLENGPVLMMFVEKWWLPAMLVYRRPPTNMAVLHQLFSMYEALWCRISAINNREYCNPWGRSKFIYIYIIHRYENHFASIL